MKLSDLISCFNPDICRIYFDNMKVTMSFTQESGEIFCLVDTGVFLTLSDQELQTVPDQPPGTMIYQVRTFDSFKTAILRIVRDTPMTESEFYPTNLTGSGVVVTATTETPDDEQRQRMTDVL